MFNTVNIHYSLMQFASSQLSLQVIVIIIYVVI